MTGAHDLKTEARGSRLPNVGESRPEQLLDADGAAELLNVPKSWVLAQARADRIPCIHLGRYVRFDRGELIEWARTQRGASDYHI